MSYVAMAFCGIVGGAVLIKSGIKVSRDLMFLLITPLLIHGFGFLFVVPTHMRSFVDALGNLTYSSYLVHFPLACYTAANRT